MFEAPLMYPVFYFIFQFVSCAVGSVVCMLC